MEQIQLWAFYACVAGFIGVGLPALYFAIKRVIEDIRDIRMYFGW